MNTSTAKIVASSALVALLLSGCGDLDVAEPIDDGAQGAESSALVTPEFQVEGVDGESEQLLLEQLGLSISEIRIEPLSGDGQELTYTTSEPPEFRFATSQQKTSLQGAQIELPESGRFRVSLGMEPDAEIDFEESSESDSLDLAGLVRTQDPVTDEEDETSDGKDNDGSPLPLPVEPVREDDGDDEEVMWTALELTGGEQGIFYTFLDVELVAGEQVLTIVLDLDD